MIGEYDVLGFVRVTCIGRHSFYNLARNLRVYCGNKRLHDAQAHHSAGQNSCMEI